MDFYSSSFPYLQAEPLSLWFRRIPSPVMESRAMSFARGILRLLEACGSLSISINFIEFSCDSCISYYIFRLFLNSFSASCRYYRLGNYKRFISTTEEEASYLQYCIVEPYISEVISSTLIFPYKSVHLFYYLCISFNP